MRSPSCILFVPKLNYLITPKSIFYQSYLTRLTPKHTCDSSSVFFFCFVWLSVTLQCDSNGNQYLEKCLHMFCFWELTVLVFEQTCKLVSEKRHEPPWKSLLKTQFKSIYLHWQHSVTYLWKGRRMFSKREKKRKDGEFCNMSFCGIFRGWTALFVIPGLKFSELHHKEKPSCWWQALCSF